MNRQSNPTKQPVAWFSFRGKKYIGPQPAYYEPGNYPWTAETEKVFEQAISASHGFLAQFGKTADPYFNKSLMSKKNGWKQGALYFWGKQNNALCESVPEIDRFVRSIPGMLSAGLSLLQPQTSIHAHYGDTDAVMRCHIGIEIPAGLPTCGMKVKDETRGWQRGKWLLFCDAHLHEAWNHSDSERLVLIVDVMLPEFLPQRRAICADVRSMLSLQRLEQVVPVVKKLPGRIRGIIRRFFRIIHYFRLRNE